VADGDDLYGGRRDSTKRIRTYTYYRNVPSPTPYYGGYDNWWWRWNSPFYTPYNSYQRPNVIIVQPKPEAPKQYQKRPDREGNGGVAIPLEKRRGRIN
jgi:hypothetical protein